MKSFYFIVLLLEMTWTMEYDDYYQDSVESENKISLEPTPKWQGYFGRSYSPQRIMQNLMKWHPSRSGQYIWEKSGLHQGDIMLRSEHDVRKNGIADPDARWDDGIIPYFISEEFSTSEKHVIQEAITEIEGKTCIKFRPYEPEDEDYVKIQATTLGCWSFVGRVDGGQAINLQRPLCVKHHVVVHELMHVIGFFHQQSVPNRDAYVNIHWQNINEDEWHNFIKNEDYEVEDFGVGYDYNSIMHYSALAFTKNGGVTLTPKVAGMRIGHMGHLSNKDALKVQKMYEGICENRDVHIDLDLDNSLEYENDYYSEYYGDYYGDGYDDFVVARRSGAGRRQLFIDSNESESEESEEESFDDNIGGTEDYGYHPEDNLIRKKKFKNWIVNFLAMLNGLRL